MKSTKSEARNPKTKGNYAFIDSQNLNLGIKNDVINKKNKVIYKGQSLDYAKFRNYLREKYGVTKAFIFIGLIPTNNSLYTYLQSCGFTLVFKEVTWYINKEGKTIVKGNVDTDLVLYSAVKTVDQYKKAIFISGDGDFVSLYNHLEELDKLAYIFVPNRHKYSWLLNRFREKLRFVSDLQSILYPIKKTRSGGRNSSLVLPGHGDIVSIAKKSTKSNNAKTTKNKKSTK